MKMRLETNLRRWYEYGMMATVNTAQAPECEAQTRVRIETEGNVPRRIQLASEFHGSTERRDSRVRHLDSSQHARRRDAEVKIG